MTIQPENLMLIGILLLSLVTVESGGYFLTRVHRGSVAATALQKGFYRAGHAHAAVLLVLSIAILTVIDHAELTGAWSAVARLGVPVAAILMPAGFFLSALGRGRERPSRLIVVLWLGAASLTAGLLASGVGLLLAGLDAM